MLSYVVADAAEAHWLPKIGCASPMIVNMNDGVAVCVCEEDGSILEDHCM